MKRIKKLGRKKETYPSKTEINLLQKEVTSSSPSRIIPMAIFLSLLIYAIFRFGVAEGIYRNYKLDSDIKRLETQVAEIKEFTKDYETVMSEYVRYSFEKYTPEEIALYDRMDIVGVVDELIMPAGVCRYYKLDGNVLSLRIREITLSEASVLMEKLYSVPEVKSVTLRTASGEEAARSDEMDMTITFRGETDVPAADKSSQESLADKAAGMLEELL